MDEFRLELNYLDCSAMNELELTPSQHSQTSIDDAWTSVLNELYGLVSISHFKSPKDAHVGQIRAYNVSTGRFISGVSQCYLRAPIIEHFNRTGRLDNRFIGLKDADELGLKLYEGAKPKVILRYANSKVDTQFDDSTGELIESVTELNQPYRSFQNVYHFSQFEDVPETASDFQDVECVTVEDINQLMVSVTKQLGVEIRILDKPTATFSYADRIIYLPHPQLFRSSDDFYGQAVRQLSKAVILCADLPLANAVNANEASEKIELASTLLCDRLESSLMYKIRGEINKSVCAEALATLSSKPMELLTLMFAIEQCANYVVNHSGLVVKLLTMQSMLSESYQKQVLENLNRFSEKPKSPVGVEQFSENITIEL